MKVHKHNPESEDHGIDLAPMLDFVLNLLIFFIITTSFIKEAGVTVVRPDATTAEYRESGNILVAIRENGDIWMDRKPVDIREVRTMIERLHIERPDDTAVIIADTNSQATMLAQVMDEIRQGGIIMTTILANLRFPIALVLGLLLNGTMFWTLYTLTNGSFDLESTEATRIEFTRMRRDSETQTRREEKVEREPPPATPDLPQISMNNSSMDNNMVSLAPTIDTSGAMSGLNLSAGSDRDVVPLVRINPDYPQRALSRGLEGWVQVQFTISETGSVLDPIVIDSSPKGIFDDAAIKAISRWRYNPKIEGAVAVQRVGIQTIIRFTLEDE